MKRFCNFPSELWSYFLEVDQRFNGPATTKPSPGMVSPRHRDFHHIKAVIWDVYGTLCSLDYGDLEKTLQWHEILRPAAKTTIEEFHLRDNLLQCYPSDEPEAKLVELFLEQIDQSHQASRDRGIEHPEVVIEIIWQKILDPLCKENNVHHSSESKSQTSYRIAYFFDACLQKMTLFDGMAQCLGTIKESGLVQGIISNAQFY